MMLVRLSGATSLRDSKCSDLLAQWMSSSPLIRARFAEAMDHAPLPAAQPPAQTHDQAPDGGETQATAPLWEDPTGPSPEV